jgi:hypothetical protein
MSDFVGTSVTYLSRMALPRGACSQMGVIDTDFVHGAVLGALHRFAYCRTHWCFFGNKQIICEISQPDYRVIELDYNSKHPHRDSVL